MNERQWQRPWSQFTERVAMTIAWNLIPKKIRYWVVVRAFADATQCNEGRGKMVEECNYHLVMRNMR